MKLVRTEEKKNKKNKKDLKSNSKPIIFFLTRMKSLNLSRMFETKIVWEKWRENKNQKKIRSVCISRCLWVCVHMCCGCMRAQSQHLIRSCKGIYSNLRFIFFFGLFVRSHKMLFFFRFASFRNGIFGMDAPDIKECRPHIHTHTYRNYE